MKLNIKERKAERKSDAKQLRREGNIPVAIYSRGNPTETLAVSGSEMQSLIRSIPKGMLSTKVLTLVAEDNKERKVIVKDIQYHPSTYEILHMDFEELKEDVPVNVNVPIVCTGVMECVGIKLGGVLRQVIRQLKVRCLPKDIPTSFEMDVSKLRRQQSKRLADLSIPPNVRPIANMSEVAVAIVKR